MTKPTTEEEIVAGVKRGGNRHRRSINEARIADLQEQVQMLHLILSEIYALIEATNLTRHDDRLEQLEKALKEIRELTYANATVRQIRPAQRERLFDGDSRVGEAG